MAYEICGINAHAWFQRGMAETLSLSDRLVLPAPLVDTSISANFDFLASHALTGVSTNTSGMAVAVWTGFDSAEPSIAGGSLTWTRRVYIRETNSSTVAIIWTAPISTQLSSATVTVTPVQGSSNGHLTVIGVTGSATNNQIASASGAGGQVVATSITTAGSQSLVFSGWVTAQALASPVWASGNESIDTWIKGDSDYSTGRLTGNVDAGTYTVGLTSNASIQWVIAALEITAA
jgi:hypothetical protein